MDWSQIFTETDCNSNFIRIGRREQSQIQSILKKNEFLPFFLVFCHVWIKNQFDTLDAWTTPWDHCDLLSKSYGGDLGRETVQDANRIVTIVIKLWLSQYCGRQFGPFFHVFSTFWFFPDQMRWPSGPIILVIVSLSNEDNPGFFTASKTLVLMENFA